LAILYLLIAKGDPCAHFEADARVLNNKSKINS
jgi:hypothetical protein